MMSNTITSSTKNDPCSTSSMIPPPPLAYNSSWRLLSQGAEARLWLIPDYLTITTPSSSTTTRLTKTTAAVCKERFPKSYRHPKLDASITKSRTKGEAKCLVRCRKGGVSCPTVLGVEAATAAQGKDRRGSSSCIYLEYIEGCTVREYLGSRAHGVQENESDFIPERDSDDEKEDTAARDAAAALSSEPPSKRAKVADGSGATSNGSGSIGGSGVKLTRVDEQALLVARKMGEMVADMHNVNIVHGDLTTSNVMMRNPPNNPNNGGAGMDMGDEGGEKGDTTAEKDWKPRLVLIDFGLSGTAGNKGVSHEERAVDLYVLERAFEATHPGSRELVDEVLRAYKRKCKTSDSVMQRLSQVRLRGRKRECFG